jgi:hypothetical protein
MAQAIGWRWQVDIKPFPSVPAYEELHDEGGCAAPRYWEPDDEVDCRTRGRRGQAICEIAKHWPLRGELVSCLLLARRLS